MGDTVEASWFAEKIADRSIRGIALETSALIRAGVLPIGTRLPAIRDIAYELHVSPATISEVARRSGLATKRSPLTQVPLRPRPLMIFCRRNSLQASEIVAGLTCNS